MRRLLLVLSLAMTFSQAPLQAQEFPGFKMQELETGLGVGYAVLLVDVNNDGKKDIVVVDTDRVLWYENPTWKKRIIIQGGTRKDNVCIDAFDIDGDGQIDFALGADWAPFNTKSGGTLQWLKRGKTLDDPWSIHPIDTEPTVHRIRFIDIDGNGKPALVSVPLMGRGSSKDNNWTDGLPVRVTAYRIPKDPVKDRWLPEVLDQSMHVCHNFWPIERARSVSDRRGQDILVASYEGVNLLTKIGPMKWERKHLGIGNQDNPKGNRGASEIKQGKLKNGRKVIATIEPWHGNQVVVYTEPTEVGKLWDRHVVDTELKWGHGVWFADLDGDGNDELIIGVRDGTEPKTPQRRASHLPGEGREGEQVGIARSSTTAAWPARTWPVADLNGDGKIDIVAVGRQTHNVRIYWNQGKQ